MKKDIDSACYWLDPSHLALGEFLAEGAVGKIFAGELHDEASQTNLQVVEVS